ncbi:STAS domain-containing protein [Rhodoferax antarcticus]|uniref:STAS domain-containing protein n=1 Tax=Rhodoferax antarcticus TaxID=81479 RepID=UPI002224C356|nr:STAS domain-containing protein [Rhodoferax antarcticus]MCW2314100.1 ABC-type transporter Mla MlaB component [Rhodoferax antarcticus]
MASKDTPTGLLARVANFVRSPANEVSARHLATSPQEGEAGKQTIKRMIERKAHNDAVRHREFSQLRKLREASPAALSEMAARASFYQDSTGFAESVGRESTLKKIDDIEAQMSKQWWTGHQGKPTEANLPAKRSDRVQASPNAASAELAHSQLDTYNTFAPTMPTHLAESERPKPTRVAAVPASPQNFEMSGQSGFSNSSVVSIDMGKALDPVLEDAAIRFANSDDTGAESVLLLALQGDQATADLKDTWTTALLDMYRCTGQLASYERLALEYAQRADWEARNPGVMRQVAASAVSQPGYASWQSPAILDKAAVLQLQASVASGHSHARLDWLGLKAITTEGSVALASLMAQWCDQPLALQFDNLEVLDTLLRIHTPLGDRQVPQFWWQLRLSTLRVLTAQNEFELVSMDYCVTYEVSPPAWETARCHRAYAPVAPVQRASSRINGHPDTSSCGPLTEPTPFVDASACRVALSGEVMGSAAAGLDALQAALQASGDVLVSCDSLVRVDFSAAGSILNWVASAQAADKKVEFCRLPHLVAAFFNLIGINEHARVTARAN